MCNFFNVTFAFLPCHFLNLSIINEKVRIYVNLIKDRTDSIPK